MAYYNVCPKCGCNLDPGEKCDCESLKIEHQETSRFFYSQFLRADDSNGQMSFVFDHPQLLIVMYIFASIGFITEPCAEPPVSYLCKLLDMFMLTNQLLN